MRFRGRRKRAEAVDCDDGRAIVPDLSPMTWWIALVRYMAVEVLELDTGTNFTFARGFMPRYLWWT